MEKLFDSESIINEIEGDDSDSAEDEDQYNKNFMSELHNLELDYVKNRKDSTSPESYGNKFKSSYTQMQNKIQKAKPYDEYKLKTSGSQNNKELEIHKFSPYAESEKRLTNQLK
jgi:hypothetical protein